MSDLVPRGCASAESEAHFRQLFRQQLHADGLSAEDSARLVFRTPDAFHQAPTADTGLTLLEAFRAHYARQLPHAWYFEGRGEAVPQPSSPTLRKPAATFVVVPGIFGEFIDTLVFQSVLDARGSRFRERWGPRLQEVEDEVYSVVEQRMHRRPLADLVRLGSIDEGDSPLLQLVVLRPLGGSLETLGSLESNVEVYQRRLGLLFSSIELDPQSDVYLIGYSRGLAVSLALVSALHQQHTAGTLPPESHTWYRQLRGVVGLGGVFYGARLAHAALSGSAGATSELVDQLRGTAGQLEIVPEGTSLKERGLTVTGNARVWSRFLKAVSDLEATAVGRGGRFLGTDLEAVYQREAHHRIRQLQLASPNASGMWSVVNGFLRKTFDLRHFASSYNRNIESLQELVQRTLEGVATLTPQARDTWWRSHTLPEDLKLFSITGMMPEAYLDDFDSPLSSFPGFGTRTSDYNVALRSSFYDTLAHEGTQINDSQVTHSSSRYWPEMYPEHQYEHYYLGALGTHHWGMAFPYMIAEKKRTRENAFPRATLLRTLALFIDRLDTGDSP